MVFGVCNGDIYGDALMVSRTGTTVCYVNVTSKSRIPYTLEMYTIGELAHDLSQAYNLFAESKPGCPDRHAV